MRGVGEEPGHRVARGGGPAAVQEVAVKFAEHERRADVLATGCRVALGSRYGPTVILVARVTQGEERARVNEYAHAFWPAAVDSLRPPARHRGTDRSARRGQAG